MTLAQIAPPVPLIEQPPSPMTFMGITASFEFITPQYALELLKHKHAKRNLKANKVEQFRRALVAGTFRLNGESLKINAEGVLLDGHHRCTACVQAGIGFWVLVVRGAIDLSTVDTGTHRSLADTLKLMGYNNTVTLAAVIGLLWCFKRGVLGEPSLENMRPNTQEALAILDRNPSIVDSVRFAIGHHSMGNVTQLAWLHWLCKSDTVESIEAFIIDLTTGVECAENNPAMVMRARILKNRDSHKKLLGRAIFAMIIKCWNDYRAGNLISRVQWRGYGALKESWPRPDGAIDPEVI